MNMNNFYCTPKKVGGESIVRELSKKFGLKKGDKYEFKPSPIYSGKRTLYNGFVFFLKVIASQNVALVVRNERSEEEVLGNWKIADIRSSLLSKNSSIDLTIAHVKELIIEQKLSVKFNKSITKDHGTLWRFK